jgi:hypothetical protein
LRPAIVSPARAGDMPAHAPSDRAIASDPFSAIMMVAGVFSRAF